MKFEQTLRWAIVLLMVTHTLSVETFGQNRYKIYEGKYKSEDGTVFTVVSKDSFLILSTDAVNLFKYADNWSDERVQKCNEKTLSLIEATIMRDKDRVRTLFGASRGNMEDYINAYLSMHKDVLLAIPKPIRYEVINTFYLDEISDHGHGPDGWRWTTYAKSLLAGR